MMVIADGEFADLFGPHVTMNAKGCKRWQIIVFIFVFGCYLAGKIQYSRAHKNVDGSRAGYESSKTTL